jgi:hypothetical protein
MIIEYILVGFFSAIGWWGATHYVITPYFPPDAEKIEQVK